MDIKSTKKDSSIAEGGSWEKDLPGMGDLELKVRSANSRIVRNALNEKIGNDPAAQEPENRERITAEVYAEAVLLDWKNLTDGGEPVPFSQELATKWLVDPDYDDFYQAVETASLRVATKAKQAMEKLAKN